MYAPAEADGQIVGIPAAFAVGAAVHPEGHAAVLIAPDVPVSQRHIRRAHRHRIADDLFPVPVAEELPFDAGEIPALLREDEFAFPFLVDVFGGQQRVFLRILRRKTHLHKGAASVPDGGFDGQVDVFG